MAVGQRKQQPATAGGVSAASVRLVDVVAQIASVLLESFGTPSSKADGADLGPFADESHIEPVHGYASRGRIGRARLGENELEVSVDQGSGIEELGI